MDSTVNYALRRARAILARGIANRDSTDLRYRGIPIEYFGREEILEMLVSANRKETDQMNKANQMRADKAMERQQERLVAEHCKMLGKVHEQQKAYEQLDPEFPSLGRGCELTVAGWLIVAQKIEDLTNKLFGGDEDSDAPSLKTSNSA